MKTSNTQELKPVYIHETGYSTHDEISLVDLATILIRRRWMIAIFSIIITALGVTKTLLSSPSYRFSTTIEMGSQVINDSIKTFESPQSLLAKLEFNYVPQTLVEYQQSKTNNKKTYQIHIVNPKHSSIISLEVKGTESESKEIKWILQNVALKAIDDHSRTYNSLKKILELRLSKEVSRLNSIYKDKNNSNSAEIVAHQATIDALETQLANLRNTRVISPPIKSVKPLGNNKRNIIVVIVIGSIFLGIFFALIAEFAANVRAAYKLDSTNKN